ncbi:TolC family protein, partial [Terriglobus sp. YAF25]
MQRRTRTACFTLTLATLTLLARGQDLAPRSAASMERAAEQHSDISELPLEQAIELAIANNSNLKTAS